MERTISIRTSVITFSLQNVSYLASGLFVLIIWGSSTSMGSVYSCFEACTKGLEMLGKRLGLLGPYAPVGHASTYVKLQDRNVLPKGEAHAGIVTPSLCAFQNYLMRLSEMQCMVYAELTAFGRCAVPPREVSTSKALQSLRNVRNARDLAEACSSIAPG